MSKTVQLQILKEEEKVLRDIEAKLRNQLTRLKVEELTLVNHIRSVEEEQASTLVTDGVVEVVLQDSPAVGELYSENNKPVLDLDVNKQLLMLAGADEEEEEEEDDDDDDVTDHDQLTAFMKQLEKNAS